MNKKSGQSKAAADKLVRTIRRKTRQTVRSQMKLDTLQVNIKIHRRE